MPDKVPILIEVEHDAAAALDDPRTRAAMGQLISRILARGSRPGDLALAIAAVKAEARAAGLTDTDIDEELATYNAERRRGPESV